MVYISERCDRFANSGRSGRSGRSGHGEHGERGEHGEHDRHDRREAAYRQLGSVCMQIPKTRSKEDIIRELLRVRGVGEKLAEEMYAQGIHSIEQLAKAPGVPERIRLFAKYYKDIEAEIPGAVVENFTAWIDVAALKKEHPALMHVEEVISVGAYRRGLTSFHDIDILVLVSERASSAAAARNRLKPPQLPVALPALPATSAESATLDPPSDKTAEGIESITKEVIGAYASTVEALPQYRGEVARGNTIYEFLIQLAGKVRVVELYFASAEDRGSALMHWTGPSTFNILIRKRAKARGMKLSQHGLFRLVNGELIKIASKTEASIFKALGLRYYSPSERMLKETMYDIVHSD